MFSKKKILLVSNGFYPELSPRSFRATELAKEFVRQGHDVTVISKFRDANYDEFLKKTPLTLKMWHHSDTSLLPELPGTIGQWLTRVVNRLLLMFFEYPAIKDVFKVKKMLMQESGYDLLISFAVPYPVHWGTAWARTRKHPIALKWVADCGDPYMGCQTDSFKKLFYFKYIEKWFCRKADFISIPVESAKSAYYKEFHEKSRVIPQGFALDEINLPAKIQNEITPTFAYAGSFIPGIRDPRKFLDHISKLNRPFRFIIYTNSPDLVKPYLDIMPDKLVIKEYIPREKLINILAGMDFLVNFDNNTSVQLPSKLIDYALTQRPVLNISDHMDGSVINSFMDGDYSNKMSLGTIEQHNIKNVAGSFLNLLNG